MSKVTRNILSRFPSVVRLIAENPFRRDFGHADFPTLISLLLLSVALKGGKRAEVIGHVMQLTSYHHDHIQFLLDQYEGSTRHHLWRRDAGGNYRLLI